MLDQFNPLLERFGLKLNGELDSRIKLQNAEKHITLNSLLDFTNFKLNDNLIGEMHVKTDYITKEQRLQLDGYTTLGFGTGFGIVKNLAFNGNYYFDKRQETIDLDFKANPLNLQQWFFIVMSSADIAKHFGKNKTVGLTTLENAGAKRIQHFELCEAIALAEKQLDHLDS